MDAAAQTVVLGVIFHHVLCIEFTAKPNIIYDFQANARLECRFINT